MSPFAKFNSAPKAHGLYDPSRDRDACGLAMVATLRGTAGHDIIQTALNALRNLEHRGAIGSDAGTGDGAGILSQIPDGFFRAVVDFKLPAKGSYGAGLVFLDSEDAVRIESAFANLALEENLRVIGWRDVPVRPENLGELARRAMPLIRQVFVTSENASTGMQLERQLYRLR